MFLFGVNGTIQCSFLVEMEQYPYNVPFCQFSNKILWRTKKAMFQPENAMFLSIVHTVANEKEHYKICKCLILKEKKSTHVCNVPSVANASSAV
jgi:hypothetical protein